MGDCDCEECVGCCKYLPGFFNGPDEVIKVAKYLGLTLKEFLTKYCVSGWRDDIIINDQRYNIKAVAPARDGWQGKRETWGYPIRGTPCIFLVEGRCQIHRVKPYECKMSFGCDKRTPGLSHRNICLLGWDRATKENQVPEAILEFWATAY